MLNLKLDMHFEGKVPEVITKKKYRFWNACKRNDEEAYNRLLAHHKWYVETQPQNITTGEIMIPYKSNMFQIKGELDGFPIVHVDCDTIENCSNDLFIKYVIYIMETIETKYPDKHIVFIFDMKKIGRKHCTRDTINVTSQIFHLFDQHYPDKLHMAYVTNTPFVFRTVWGILKRVIRKETREKICFENESKVNYILKLEDDSTT